MPSVQRIRWAKTRILLTTLVGLAILGTLIVLLTGGSLFEPRTLLYVYVPDATGIDSGSPVRVDGIQVGKVQSVELSGSADPNRVVKVTMKLEAGRLASITEDSTAQPAADTLVGDKFIQISSGKSLRRIRGGNEIAYKGAPDLIKSIDLSQFRQQLASMDVMLTGIENGQGLVGQFVMGEEMYTDITTRLAGLRRGIHAASSRTSALGRELYTDALFRQVSAPVEALDQRLAMLQSGQGSAGRLLQDNAQYDQLRAQIAAVRRDIGDARQSKMLSSPAAYDDFNRSLATWIQKVDEFNITPMMSTTAVYDNLTGLAKELRESVNDFRGNPRKFLRMGFF